MSISNETIDKQQPKQPFVNRFIRKIKHNNIQFKIIDDYNNEDNKQKLSNKLTTEKTGIVKERNTETTKKNDKTVMVNRTNTASYPDKQIKWLEFKHNPIHIENNNKHVIVLTNIEELQNIKIFNWKLNRPIDKTRIPDIIKNNKDKTMLEGTIYLFKNTVDTKRYYCYDGMHRIASFKGVNKKCKIIVDLMLEPTNGQIVDRFTHINESISVPELYTNNLYDIELKQTITNVVEYFMRLKPNHFSPSKNFKVPHCNRETMTNMLTDMIDNIPDLCHYTQEEWINELLLIEKNIKTLVVNRGCKLSTKQLQKCISNDFYLFAVKDWNNKVYVNKP